MAGKEKLRSIVKEPQCAGAALGCPAPSSCQRCASLSIGPLRFFCRLPLRLAAAGCPILPASIWLVNRVLTLSSCACRLPQRLSGLRLALSCQRWASLSRVFCLCLVGLASLSAALSCRADNVDADRFWPTCQAPMKLGTYAPEATPRHSLHNRQGINDKQGSMPIGRT